MLDTQHLQPILFLLAPSFRVTLHASQNFDIPRISPSSLQFPPQTLLS